ncbi:MCE family protein [Mycolicibacterium pyrenivorans]|uniref:MCE family protein n=1 Tax=Mycolicibacterium pyrenivorans TaxID=187102 RepID=UPI0021F2651B|nr:MlaD family protein [Mycolicibacterium pyrenivorans]MCV7152895.1 MCE family protein [Mycolicibacterium pyrenivorans]
MMRQIAVPVKVLVFTLTMSLLTAFLIVVFSQYRTGASDNYSAVFGDVSGLRPGDSVRVAGIRIGTVTGVTLRDDKRVVVDFDADDDIVLTTGTKAAVRYLNLVGDRYLELLDAPGSTRVVPAGSQIPDDRTSAALDLDLLLGGLKPVVQGLDPQDINALTSSLIQIMQGQGGTIESLMAHTSTFTNALADNSQVVEQLIDNLNGVMATLAKDGEQFSGTIQRLRQLVGELSAEREPIGSAIESLSAGTASLADLLTQARPPLATTVDELHRLAPSLVGQQDRIEAALERAPENLHKLTRLGAYGSFFNYYLCGLTARVSDLENRTAVFPVYKQEGGRCAEPS